MIEKLIQFVIDHWTDIGAAGLLALALRAMWLFIKFLTNRQELDKDTLAVQKLSVETEKDRVALERERIGTDSAQKAQTTSLLTMMTKSNQQLTKISQGFIGSLKELFTEVKKGTDAADKSSAAIIKGQAGIQQTLAQLLNTVNFKSRQDTAVVSINVDFLITAADFQATVLFERELLHRNIFEIFDVFISPEWDVFGADQAALFLRSDQADQLSTLAFRGLESDRLLVFNVDFIRPASPSETIILILKKIEIDTALIKEIRAAIKAQLI